MATSAQTSRPRHYIVVVHGIGEQRYNETAVEVVHRFAEARADGPIHLAGLMPADLSSQSIRRAGGGYGWSEFRGIPVNPADNTGTFDGTRAARTAGRNFRFVDLRWADILQEHADSFSSPPEQWANSRVKRLSPPYTPSDWLPIWAMPLLHEVDGSVVPAKTLMTKASSDLADLVFNRVIGDVHLYGDYARTRGQAVRRFHWVLDEICLRDYMQWCCFERQTAEAPYVQPVFTILAHSLGTVLSFDALTYAFATPEIRLASTRHPAHSIPFPGYTERVSTGDHDETESWAQLVREIRETPRRNGHPDGTHDWRLLTSRHPGLSEAPPTIPPLLWRHRVKHFVSLGSPIDKYHVLWHHNYRHMGLNHPAFDQDWADGWLDDQVLARLDEKILHYNLCDEQDPVGHHLDVASHTRNYSRVFQYERTNVVHRDVVFRRYPIPGAAHVQYWKDPELFQRLVSEVLDNGQPGQFVEPSFIEKPGTYKTALVWAYFRIPLIAAIITGGLLSYGWISLITKDFSMSYVAAIVGALLLWTVPNLLRGYAKELGPSGKDGEAASAWHERWRPKAGLLANLVRGMVAWRRILIWLNDQRDYRIARHWNALNLRIVQHDHSAYTVRAAQTTGTRLTLKTQGGFWRTVWWRIGGGILALALSAGASCLAMRLSTSPNPAMDSDWTWAQTLLISGWTGMTISACYLAIMAYVVFWFYRLKYGVSVGHSAGPADEHPPSHP